MGGGRKLPTEGDGLASWKLLCGLSWKLLSDGLSWKLLPDGLSWKLLLDGLSWKLLPDGLSWKLPDGLSWKLPGCGLDTGDEMGMAFSGTKAPRTGVVACCVGRRR